MSISKKIFKKVQVGRQLREVLSKKTAEIWYNHRLELIYAGVLMGTLCVLPDTSFAQSTEAQSSNAFTKLLGTPLSKLSDFVTVGIGGTMAAAGIGKAVYEKFVSQNQQGMGTAVGLVGGGAVLANADSLISGVTGLSVSTGASGLVFF